MAVNGRAKGAAGEREFCKWLQKKFELDFLPERNLEQVRSGGSDILGVYPFVFEVKRVESLDIVKAWIQCKTDARAAGGEPVVAFRKNRQPWEFLISATHIGNEFGFIRMDERTFLEWAERKIGKPGLFASELETEE